MKYPFKVDFRVAFRDVDLHDVLHHSNYFYYCEKGRVQLLRSVNLPYKKIMEMGIGLMLVECKLKFIAPVKFDEILNIYIGNSFPLVSSNIGSGNPSPFRHSGSCGNYGSSHKFRMILLPLWLFPFYFSRLTTIWRVDSSFESFHHG